MEELKTILQIIGQGGVSIIVFVIWYFTFTRANKAASEAFRKHEELSAALLQLLKDEQEYKIHLVGVLSRLELKLEQPVQCPLIKSHEVKK